MCIPHFLRHRVVSHLLVSRADVILANKIMYLLWSKSYGDKEGTDGIWNEVGIGT